MPLFTRKQPADAAVELEATATDEVVDENLPAAYTPKKDRATPKRAEAQRRRKEPPPTNRREAVKRARDKARSERAEQYAGMKAGDERYLLPRDQGPERGLVRDIVDSRRTAGTWFFGGAFLILFATQVQIPVVQFGANIVWLLLALAVIGDSILIARKIKRMVLERYPKTEQRMRSLYFYGIMRGVSFRKLRIPKPRVKIGDAI